MNRLLPAMVSALCVSACSTQPLPVAPAPSQIGSAHQQATDTTEIPAENELQSIEPSSVKQSEVPIAAANANELVCRYESRTGSHRKTKVCRTRAQMMRLEEQGKDTFETLRNAQTQGNNPALGEN